MIPKGKTTSATWSKKVLGEDGGRSGKSSVKEKKKKKTTKQKKTKKKKKKKSRRTKAYSKKIPFVRDVLFRRMGDGTKKGRSE